MEEIALKYLEQNDGWLSCEDLLDRIVKGEELPEAPDSKRFRAALESLAKQTNSHVIRQTFGNLDKFAYERNVNRLIVNERELDEPLIQWLDEKRGIAGRALPSGGGAGRGEKGTNHWRFPDVVGHTDHRKVKPGLRNFWKLTGGCLEISSYELKQELTLGNVREVFFQCLANSAWANRRYVVAWDVRRQACDEFKKLAERYGMGLIELAVLKENDRIRADLEETRVLIECPRQELDVQAIRDLYENTGWKPFIEWVDGIV